MKRYKDTFLPIPSLNYKYEINRQGRVRNIETKCELQEYVKLYPDDSRKASYRSIYQLLWEVHGILHKPNCKKNVRRVSVLISKGSEQYYFETLRACANFLSRREHYSTGTFKKYLTERQSEIYGWKVEYFAEPPRPNLAAHDSAHDLKGATKNDIGNRDEKD